MIIGQLNFLLVRNGKLEMDRHTLQRTVLTSGPAPTLGCCSSVMYRGTDVPGSWYAHPVRDLALEKLSVCTLRRWCRLMGPPLSTSSMA